MEHYSLLRAFADSWMLLFLFTFFVVMVVWVLTGRSRGYRDTADIIFRHDDKPLSDPVDHDAASGSGKEARS